MMKYFKNGWNLTALIMAVALVSYISYDQLYVKKKQPSSTTPPLTAINITAQEYYQHYRNNAVAADARFMGKLITVSGTIARIDKDAADHIYIALHVDEGDDVYCYLKDEKQVLNLLAGDQVSFVGIGAGYSITGPAVMAEQLLK